MLLVVLLMGAVAACCQALLQAGPPALAGWQQLLRMCSGRHRIACTLSPVVAWEQHPAPALLQRVNSGSLWAGSTMTLTTHCCSTFVPAKHLRSRLQLPVLGGEFSTGRCGLRTAIVEQRAAQTLHTLHTLIAQPSPHVRP